MTKTSGMMALVLALLAWPSGMGDLAVARTRQGHSYPSDPSIDTMQAGKDEHIASKKVSGGATLNGPFDFAGDRTMLREHRIEIVVARNAGGDSASAKIEAARELGLPVVMVRRPFIPVWERVETIAEALRWLDHDVAPTERGV